METTLFRQKNANFETENETSKGQLRPVAAVPTLGVHVLLRLRPVAQEGLRRIMLASAKRKNCLCPPGRCVTGVHCGSAVTSSSVMLRLQRKLSSGTFSGCARI